MTKLPGGDVLIAGGNDGKRAIRHLEIYASGKRRFLPDAQAHAHGAPAAQRPPRCPEAASSSWEARKEKERGMRSFIRLPAEERGWFVA